MILQMIFHLNLKFLIFQLQDHIGFLTLYMYIGTQYVILSEGVLEGYPDIPEPSEVG